jgi:hypothetical protein
MKKVIKLTESDLNRIVKRVLKEESMGIEPVIDRNSKSVGVKIYFHEGKYEIDDNLKKLILNDTQLMNILRKSLPTIEKYMGTGKIPKFITIGSQTSSTGSRDRNAEIGKKRIESMKNLIFDVLEELGDRSGFYVGEDTIESLMTINTDSNYKPSGLNPIYDRSKTKPKFNERYGYIEVKPIKTMGLDSKGIDRIEDNLLNAKGWNINPDEEKIVNAIAKLETYSDILDLDNELRREGGLEGFINSVITDGFTSMGSDREERMKIMDSINKASKNSGKGKIAKIVGDVISIILD